MTIANVNPIFVHHPVVTQSSLPATTVNTARDGSGTITTIYTADSAVNGSLVECIHFIGQGTTTTGIVNLFRKAGGTGSFVFVGQVSYTGTTPSATVAAADFFYTGSDMPMRLGTNDLLGAATTQSNTAAITALVQGGPLVNSDA